MSALWSPSFPVWQFVLRGSVIYLAILLLLRLGGKRQVGQMGTGEFVLILLVSNAFQNAMNGGDNSITGGLVLAVVLIVLSVGIAYATFRSKKIESLIEGRPRLVIHDGKLIQKNLDKEMLNFQEFMSILRRQGIHNVAEVAEAVLETNGSLSVTKKSELTPAPH
jgi:uncharacterized membrane protein YcaP (DUF421 family)